MNAQGGSPVMALQQNAMGAANNDPMVIGWDPALKSPNLDILSNGTTISNRGSNDTWQGCVSKKIFNGGKHSFEMMCVTDVSTTNTWKYIFGVAPAATFNPNKTAWVGSQGSWGYIGGTGGKCHGAGKSVPYAKGLYLCVCVCVFLLVSAFFLGNCVEKINGCVICIFVFFE